MPENIGGTVIQRSFVGTGIPNVIHIASVPTQELGMEDASLEEIVTQILGVPRHVPLTGEQYAKVLSAVRRDGPRSLAPWWRPMYEEAYFRLMEQLEGDETRSFAGAFFSLLTARYAGASMLPFLTGALIDEEFRRQFEIGAETLHTALACLASHAARPPEAQAFFEEILSYDIPLGQSPAVAGDSLLRLLETSKKACIAPLAIGGTEAVGHLAQGQYVMALLTTGTASIMTLILIGTVAVGSLIVEKVARTRENVARSQPAGPSATVRRTRRRNIGGGSAAG